MKRLALGALAASPLLFTAPAEARTIGGFSAIGFQSGCIAESFGAAQWAQTCSVEMPLLVDTAGGKNVVVTLTASDASFNQGLQIILYGMTASGAINSQTATTVHNGTKVTATLSANVPAGGYMFIFFTGGVGDSVFSINWAA